MRKTLTAAAAAATIAVAAVATPTTAEARWGWWGPALGAFAVGAHRRRRAGKALLLRRVLRRILSGVLLLPRVQLRLSFVRLRLQLRLRASLLRLCLCAAALLLQLPALAERLPLSRVLSG
jgi:hypothetical protein